LISLLHPSRSRPNKSLTTTSQWLSRAGVDVELIVSIDDNDPLRHDYLKQYTGIDPFRIKVISNNNHSAVEAINNAAKESKGDILIVVSDDTDCPDNWGKLILNAVQGREDYVLRVDDGIQDWIVTMPVMDRVYYNRFGYVYYPEFSHMFCDTFLTHQADALGKIIWRNDIVFTHLHYSVRKSDKDEVSKRADNTFHEGKQIYLNLVKKNLLLDDVNIWNLSPNAKGHLNWLNHTVR
jgi:hypothetical protein